MKFNKLALALASVAVAPLAHAGVTVTPLVGYHYNGEAHEAQREVLKTGAWINAVRDENVGGSLQETYHNSGVTLTDDLYTGVAVGIDITPSTQFQVEYGVTNADTRSSKDTWDANRKQVDGAAAVAGAEGYPSRYDGEQEIISGNFLIGADQFMGGIADSKLKPYLLVGAGQSKIEVKNQQTYSTDLEKDKYGNTKTTQTGKTGVIKAGTLVAESKDTIGNLGLGAMYHINDAVSLRGEARAIHNFDNNWWEGLALGGVQVALGRPKAAPVVPVKEVEDKVEDVEVIKVEEPTIIPEDNTPMDSDRDGVIDSQDACPGTPINLVVDERGCPRKVPVKEQLKAELRVFFDNDKSDIKPQYKPEIAKLAEKMREVPNSTAQIEGHASKTGPSARYNQRLSEARANAVKSSLSNEFGISPARISTQGYGYSRPIAPNDTAEGRAMNRRVYAIITGEKIVEVDQTKDMK